MNNIANSKQEYDDIIIQSLEDDNDDELYQNSFLSSQEAIRLTSAGQCEKDQMRQELLTFLDDSLKRKDSDGNLLISLPPNFDIVSNAMNRNDLISTEEIPWSKYLLSDNFDKDLEKDYGNRYSNVFEDNENILQRGLAEIHMLDNQLSNVNKQDAFLKAELLRSEEYSEYSNANTPRTSRSEYDTTFITRGKNNSRGSDSYSHSKASFSPTVKDDNDDNTIEIEDELDDELDEIKKALDNALSLNDTNKIKKLEKKKKNFLADNIENMTGKKKLSYLEEERVKLLLDLDDVDENNNNNNEFNNSYAYNHDEMEQIERINTALSVYGRLERSLETDDKMLNKDSSMKENTLQEQRMTRAQIEYNQKLDRMITQIQNNKVDLSYMVCKSKEGSSVHSNSTSINTIPDISEIRSDRIITLEEILEVVNDCVTENSRQKNNLSDDAIQDKKKRQDIDKLLAGMKDLVNDLSELRLNQSNQSNKIDFNSKNSVNNEKTNRFNVLAKNTKIIYNNFLEDNASTNISPTHNDDYYSEEDDSDKIINNNNHSSPVKVKLPIINPGFIRQQHNNTISSINKPKSAEYAVSKKMKNEALKYVLDKSLLKLQKKQTPPNPPLIETSVRV